MIYVLAIIVGVCALGAALVAFTRRAPRDDVARFHHARAMTTEWSRNYTTTGHVPLPNERNGHEHEQAPDVSHAVTNGNGANGTSNGIAAAKTAAKPTGEPTQVGGRRTRDPAEHR